MNQASSVEVTNKYFKASHLIRLMTQCSNGREIRTGYKLKQISSLDDHVPQCYLLNNDVIIINYIKKNF